MNELTFRDYIKIFFRQKTVILLCIFSVMVTVVLGLKFKTPVYASQTKMLITAQKQAEATYYRDIIDYENAHLALTQSEIVKSTPVVERALQAVLASYNPLSNFLTYEKRFASPLKRRWIDHQIRQLNERFERFDFTEEQRQAFIYRMALEDLRKRITVEPLRNTNIFTISVTDYDPIGAALITNIVSRSYVIFDMEQQMAEMQLKYGEKHLAVSQLKDNIQTMIKSLNGQPISDIEAIGPASVKIIEQALPAISPMGPPRRLILLLAFGASLVLGAVLALVLDYLDQTFKSPRDIERSLGVLFLGGVPNKPPSVVAYKNLAEQVYLQMKEKGLQILVLTASRNGEGVTTVSHNIGRYIASTLGHRVLIIEANPRHLLYKKKHKLSTGPGLFDVLEENATLDQAVKNVGDKLYVLPVGKTELNPNILLESHRMAEVFQEAKAEYELILIDSASLSASKDALKLLSVAEAVAIIISEGHVRRHAVKAALDNLNVRKINVLGAILNKRIFPIPQFVYERV